MAVKLQVTAPKLKYYTVKGDTLKDIWQDILKKGPKDPNDNKKVAALSETSFSTSPSWNHQIVDSYKIFDGQTTCKIKVKDWDVQYWSVITFPKLGANKLSAKAKKEWTRFVTKLKPHELKHVEKGLAEMKKVVKEFQAMESSAIGKDEKEAVALARANMEDHFVKTYGAGGKKIEARLNKIHKKFDHATSHGTSLDTSIT
ncbi:hypothetical protein LNKW23_14950 [Paralimibaculum aggregatum]|uniref:DUF922 domain-containing protein n=1 Tax=Paralimibaculum aggregatum TaxID=3036245 RepID=A0ABQ6LKU2_9RHOB|nr:DUF922 domain-containing protein [Limibaculum sp. NKW23]GMG82282.1 hypothetical protein LNKW23_14950 [Limibaculum sp. NKW23]